jgi:hypothetical protein
MNLFWWVIKNVLWTVDTILYKKSFSYRPNLFMNTFIISFYYFIAWSLFLLFFYWKLNIIFSLAVSMFFVNIVRFITETFNQKIYSQEKISTLMPYSKLDTVIWMIIAFFIFWWVSWLSFLIALAIVFISIIPNINFKSSEKKISKMVLLYIFLKIIWAFLYVIEWYIIVKLLAFDFFVVDIFTYGLCWIVVALLSSWKMKLEDFKMPKSYHILRFSWAVLNIITNFLWAFLIVELWLIVSSILWFLWTWMTLIMSYFVFWDKPSKKDLILTIIITILVFLWFYFKDYWLN